MCCALIYLQNFFDADCRLRANPRVTPDRHGDRFAPHWTGRNIVPIAWQTAPVAACRPALCFVYALFWRPNRNRAAGRDGCWPSSAAWRTPGPSCRMRSLAELCRLRPCPSLAMPRCGATVRPRAAPLQRRGTGRAWGGADRRPAPGAHLGLMPIAAQTATGVRAPLPYPQADPAPRRCRPDRKAKSRQAEAPGRNVTGSTISRAEKLPLRRHSSTSRPPRAPSS